MSSNTSSAARTTGHEMILMILSGPEAGVSYKLMGQSVSIGRAPDNHVILQDTKSSRNHARVELRGTGYFVVDLGSQNGVLVNGAPTKEAALKPGDQLLIGSTQLRFGPPTALALAPSAMTAPLVNVASSTQPVYGHDPFAVPSTGYSLNKFYIAAGVLLIILFIAFRPGGGRGKKEINLKDETALQEQIDQGTESNEKRRQEITQKGRDTQQYAEAQSFYQKGFREFREGNYLRAGQDFEASLALFPSHPLAKRYLERSKLKLNETITASLERGEKYFQNQRYSQAKNEYQTVIRLSGDVSSKNVQLARKRIEAIDLIKQGNW